MHPFVLNDAFLFIMLSDGLNNVFDFIIIFKGIFQFIKQPGFKRNIAMLIYSRTYQIGV